MAATRALFGVRSGYLLKPRGSLLQTIVHRSCPKSSIFSYQLYIISTPTRRLSSVPKHRFVTPVVACTDVRDAEFDGVVLVTDKVERLTGGLQCLHEAVAQHKKIDAACEEEVTTLYCPSIPSKRLIFAPTGPLDRDYDDVRRFQEAALKGIKRALAAGCKAPLLVHPQDKTYKYSTQVAALGALHGVYVPLDVRDMRPEKSIKADKLGVWCDSLDAATEAANISSIMESGRYVYRDIGGTDPERSAPPRVADYVEGLFKGTCIKVNVLSDLSVMEKEYPMLVAVNRACKEIERHRARVIFLEYEGEGPIDTTLMLVGKGITYDTGGADIKIGGSMAGMHRDKCGSAFVAGFFEVLSKYKPKGLKVCGTMCMVRNSVGADAYVADEIIMSRAGERVRIGNTDAEGRMVMCDLLCQAKEQAPNEVNPHLFTIATLTGHVIRAFSDSYTAAMDNGPARKERTAEMLQRHGDEIGDMFEVSTIRREDYETHKGPSEYEDVLQSGGGPSTMQPRGHQSPAAFLIMSSGLAKHGNNSSEPLKYTHVDIAGSSGPFPGTPTGAPIAAFSQAYVFNRESGK